MLSNYKYSNGAKKNVNYFVLIVDFNFPCGIKRDLAHYTLPLVNYRPPNYKNRCLVIILLLS